MSKNTNFDIPENLRSMAETNVEKARDAYHQVMDATRKAQENMQSSSEAVSNGVQSMHSKVLKYTEENVEASFRYANDLLHASTMQDALQVQQEFARAQMEAYTKQAQEFSKIISSTQKKVQPK